MAYCFCVPLNLSNFTINYCGTSFYQKKKTTVGHLFTVINELVMLHKLKVVMWILLDLLFQQKPLLVTGTNDTADKRLENGTYSCIVLRVRAQR